MEQHHPILLVYYYESMNEVQSFQERIVEALGRISGQVLYAHARSSLVLVS
jgi:hypothetical protein